MRIFSRDDHGRKIAFDPSRAANQALSWLRPELSERGIEISLQAPASCGRVFGEPSRFEQVIVNLLLNARDAVCDPGNDGKASQGVVRIVISENLDTNVIRIVVSDNGGGVPEEILERLFEPFFTPRHRVMEPD
jgi:C4-dicarboxylate-specific signal transduction histidine kinase